MLKVIDLEDGKQITLRSSAATAIIYKNQFNSDFFADMIRLSKVFEGLDKNEKEDLSKLTYEDLDHLDMTILYQITWTFAKNADNSIGDLVSWLNQFDEFPLFEIMGVVTELLGTLFNTTKK